MDFEARTIIRNIIVALVGLGLVVLVIVLLVRGFSGGGAGQANDRIDVSRYANTSAVATLVIDGPTRLDQEHFTVRVNVSGTMNEVQVIQGYQGNIVRSQTYASNTAAYGAFLQALQLLNFSKGIESDVDYRGYCPEGRRYLYRFSNGQNELFQFWNTSCGGPGTFKGDASEIRQLFERQIPQRDLNNFLRGTGINF